MRLLRSMYAGNSIRFSPSRYTTYACCQPTLLIVTENVGNTATEGKRLLTSQTTRKMSNPERGTHTKRRTCTDSSERLIPPDMRRSYLRCLFIRNYWRNIAISLIDPE